MGKPFILAACVLCSALPFQARAQATGESFDVLASIMESHAKEINANDAVNANKKKAEQYREKLITGWWEFMQASSNAAPGEYCAASFLRAKRLTEPGKVDKMKEGAIVTLFGPGGRYRGALLAFSPLGEDATTAFPKLTNGKPARVTLKQGNISHPQSHFIQFCQSCM